MDPRLIWPLLISLALLVLLCVLALAMGGPLGLVPVPPIVLAFAAFVRSWTGKDDTPTNKP